MARRASSKTSTAKKRPSTTLKAFRRRPARRPLEAEIDERIDIVIRVKEQQKAQTDHRPDHDGVRETPNRAHGAMPLCETLQPMQPHQDGETCESIKLDGDRR